MELVAGHESNKTKSAKSSDMERALGAEVLIDEEAGVLRYIRYMTCSNVFVEFG